ncbi:MAG: DUF4870 domain-containing protein [Chloroflexota bacterium]|nr:DUF4870 domain-containing protein [Chloroflexota bacterium]
MSQSSGTNLEPNVAGLLCYVLGWITGLVFFLIEKDDDFVRFHAKQSIIVFGALSVVNFLLYILWLIPVVGWIFGALLASLVWVFALVLWVILMIKAYQGEKFKLPLIGDLAEKYS